MLRCCTGSATTGSSAPRRALTTCRADALRFEDSEAQALQAAIAEGHRPPAQQPILPAAQRPALARAKLWFSYLLSCRWCAAVWVAVPVCLGCRHLTTYDIPNLWRAVPWQEADWITFPLWTLGIAYAVGWLGAKED